MKRLPWILTALVGATAWFTAGAQAPSENELKKAFDQHRVVWFELMQGKTTATAKHKDVLEAASRFFVLRVLEVTVKDSPKLMADVQTEYSRDLIQRMKAISQASREEITKHLIARFAEVFARNFQEEHLAMVNVAMMLPELAQFKVEEYGDFLTKTIADPKIHDALKVYALRALREYFPAAMVDPSNVLANPANVAEKKKRDVERIKVLMDYIGQKWNSSLIEPSAVHYLRREAIQTLGQAQVPAVDLTKKNNAVDGPVALGLAKVLVKGGVDPEASLAEQCEAAIGLCHLKTTGMPEYDPSVAVLLVGRFMVEFTNEYKKDWVNLRDKKKGFLPWKIHAERLKVGIDELVKHTASPPVSDHAKRLQASASIILPAMAKHNSVDNLLDLQTAVERMEKDLGATRSLFKSIKGYEVDTQ